MPTHYIVWLFDSPTATFDGPNEGDAVRTRQFWGDLHKTFVKEKANRNYVGVDYTAETSHGHQPLDACLAATDSIYVIGHGEPGGDSISPYTDMKNEFLSAGDIVERLKELGLKKNSQCKLKVFACHSALRRGTEPAFAERVRDCLSFPEPFHVRVFGYTDSVRAYSQWFFHRRKLAGSTPASWSRISFLIDDIPTVTIP